MEYLLTFLLITAAYLQRYADGYINVARVLIKEGNFTEALAFLDEVEKRLPGYEKIAYFPGMIEKIRGKYDRAEALFEEAWIAYPRDRNLLKSLGQTYYFDNNLSRARVLFSEALFVDPEDATAHYNLILINKALDNIEVARSYQGLYEKYKPDEAARSISQSTRLNFHFANNEAQLIHHHELRREERKENFIQEHSQ